MTYPEFKAKFACEELSFDRSKGWPTGPDLFYRCPSCDEVMPSFPKENTHCGCRGMMFDVDAGRFSAREEKKVVILRAKKTTGIFQ